MRYSSLGLLAALLVPVLAEDCDPNAPYVVKPYDGKTTDDPAMTKRLVSYWAESICFKRSDGSEPKLEDQCKDVCIPGRGQDKDQAVLSSTSCIFGDAPWSDLRTGKPLLCGTDKDFKGTSIFR